MTLHELSDRREIDDLLIAYCHAIDSHGWDELDRVFTPDAFIDYTACGGPKGQYPEIKIFLAEALPRFAYAQHIISTSRIRLAGDRAEGRTICSNPVGVRQPDGSVRHMVYALWYIDEMVRTPDGWRLASRCEQLSHTENLPEGLLQTPY